MLPISYESHCETETMSIAGSLAREAKPGCVYGLSGGLGAGKTVFVKGFAKGLGVTELVTSPTFTIVNEYHSGRLPLFHFDIYRVDHVSGMEDTGYEEYFYGGGVCLVEWAEQAARLMPQETIYVRIEQDLSKGDFYRKITVAKEEGLC